MGNTQNSSKIQGTGAPFNIHKSVSSRDTNALCSNSNIKISPFYQKLVVDGYIRRQCSSIYILPNPISILCRNMVWGLNTFSISLNTQELQRMTSLKQMKSTNGNPTNRAIFSNERRDPSKYNMSTLYHEKKGSFDFYEFVFYFFIKSDGINHITLTVDADNKTNHMITQICLYCVQTNDLIRFLHPATLRVSIDKCKLFSSLQFICKCYMFEVHGRSGEVRLFNDGIQMDKHCKWSLEINERTLSMMTKQNSNKYYFRPFGRVNNWAISISEHLKSFSVCLNLIQIPFGCKLDVLFECEVIFENMQSQKKERQATFATPTIEDVWPRRRTFCWIQFDESFKQNMIINVTVSVLSVTGYDEDEAKQKTIYYPGHQDLYM